MNKLVQDKAFASFMDNVAQKEDAIKEISDSNAEMMTATDMMKPIIVKRIATLKTKMEIADRNLKVFRDNQPEKFGPHLFPVETYDNLLSQYRQKKAELAANVPVEQPKKNIKFKNKPDKIQDIKNVLSKE